MCQQTNTLMVIRLKNNYFYRKTSSFTCTTSSPMTSSVMTSQICAIVIETVYVKSVWDFSGCMVINRLFLVKNVYLSTHYSEL